MSRTTTLLLSLLTLVLGTYNNPCQTICQCVLNEIIYGTEFIVNCSAADIQHVPQDFSELINVLDLLHNQITSNPNIYSYQYLFKLILKGNMLDTIKLSNLPNLQELDMSNCNIKDLDNVKINQISLKTLKLTNNPIQHADKFESSTLLSLDLSYCKIKHIKTELLEKLPSILEINLENNPIAVIDELFSKTLTNINLSRLSIRFLRGSHLESLETLKRLNLSNNVNLISMNHAGSIINHSIEELDFSNSNILDINIEELTNIRLINFMNNKIEEITSKSFKHNQMIKYINLKNNRIKTISKDSFINLVYLEQLDLSNNFISNLEWSNNLPLISLDVSFNKILKLNSKLNYLKSLDLSFNLIKNINYKLDNLLPNIINLKLNYNNIQIINYLYSESLESLELENCNLMVVNNNSFGQLNKLKHLNLIGNKIKSLKANFFFNLTNLTSLKLDNNPWDCNCNDKKFQSFYNFLTDRELASENSLICVPELNFTWRQYCGAAWSANVTPETASLAPVLYSVLTVGLVLLMVIILGCSWRYVRKTDFMDMESLGVQREDPVIWTPRAENSSQIQISRPRPQLMRSFSNSSPPSYEEATMLPTSRDESVVLVLVNNNLRGTPPCSPHLSSS